MNILSSTYIFYADVYFVQNFMIKAAVIYLSLYCNKFQTHVSTVKGIGKIVLASFLGTMLEIIGLILGDFYNFFILLIHFIELPLLFLFVVTNTRQKLFALIVTGYLFVMIINGVLEAMWNWFGEKSSYIFYLGFSCGIVIVVMHIWINYKKQQKGIFQVELMHGEKYVKTYGFYDSGNCLVDPYTKKGVHIISERLFQRLNLEKDIAVLVPYQALGKNDGMLEVYYIEELQIEGETQKKSWKGCPLGVTKENLFEEEKFEIILNEEVF